MEKKEDYILTDQMWQNGTIGVALLMMHQQVLLPLEILIMKQPHLTVLWMK